MLAAALHLALAVISTAHITQVPPEAHVEATTPATTEAEPSSISAAPVPAPSDAQPVEAAPAPTPAPSDAQVVAPVGAPSPAAVAPIGPTAAPDPAVAPLSPDGVPEIPTPELPRPRFRGIGFFVTGGLFAAVGMPFKIIATSSDTREARDIDRGVSDPSVCIEFCYVGTLFNVISAPLLVTSAGLFGGGMTMHGHWAAHRDASRGGLRSARRSHLMMGLGFGAIGAGIGAFIASRYAMRTAESEGQYVARRELGWWTLTTALYAGSGLAGYGVGYEAGRRKLAHRVQAQLAPMLSPQLVGLGVAGRF